MPAQETISEQTRPAPKRRPCRRNACTLTPAIGARTMRLGTRTGPIHHGSRRFTCTEREILRMRAIAKPCSSRYNARPRRRRGAGAYFFLRQQGDIVKEVILTPEGYQKLKQEIEYLSTEKRREVADRIRQAREFGDIAENSEYDDAKNEQALVEHRIATLEERILSARVIEKKDIA